MLNVVCDTLRRSHTVQLASMYNCAGHACSMSSPDILVKNVAVLEKAACKAGKAGTSSTAGSRFRFTRYCS
jgi:hypothetical protein